MSAPGRARNLDPRAWLVWGVAASLPSLLGRNPFPLLACLLAALGVRASVPAVGASWLRLIRLAAFFALIGVLFNLVTYHGGDQPVATIPGWVPIAGGALTLNALTYGLLSGLAVMTLVVVWSTVAQRLAWSGLVRLTPPSLAPVAVAGSIALTLAPRTIDAYADIREAQALRGYRPRGVRGLAPILAPLLAAGLERAVTSAEALEARGFGGSEAATGRGRWRVGGLVAALSAALAGAYLVGAGRAPLGLAVAALALAALVVLSRTARTAAVLRPTRYRDVRFTRADRVATSVSSAVILATLLIHAVDPAALSYEPYPSIVWPAVSLPLIAALALLLAPGFLAGETTPAGETR